VAHPKFHKEIGRWNAALEEVPNKKIAHLEKVNKHWATFTGDAQDRMVNTGKKVDLAKKWREIIDRDIGLVP